MIYKIIVTLLILLPTTCFTSDSLERNLTKTQQAQFKFLRQFNRSSKICTYQLRYLEWCTDVNKAMAKREGKTLEEFIKEENKLSENFKK